MGSSTLIVFHKTSFNFDRKDLGKESSMCQKQNAGPILFSSQFCLLIALLNAVFSSISLFATMATSSASFICWLILVDLPNLRYLKKASEAHLKQKRASFIVKANLLKTHLPCLLISSSE